MIDLTKITTPFGLLDAETQQELRDYRGPIEYYSVYDRWISTPKIKNTITTYRAEPAPVTKPHIPWDFIDKKWLWAARDASGDLYVFPAKPKRMSGTWSCVGWDNEDMYQQLIASVMLRRLFDARVGTENHIYDESHVDRFLPYPVFVVIEEAHRFAPHAGEAKSKSILKTILAEGRKFGIGICMVSQRPSKLDADSLSQCMTQITMRIINPTDQEHIAQSIESASRDLIDELPSLARGQAIISGVAINTPTLVKIRTRLTTDIKGRSKDAPSIWVAQKRYEKKYEIPEIKADEEMDIGV